MEARDFPILMIEDSEDDQILIRRAFRRAQLATPLLAVGDGDEAVAYLSGLGRYADRQAYPLPALALLDLKLPRRSGLEVLAWMRAQPSLKRIPVVVLTSSGESADIDRAYELGANTYLTKPVSFDGLREMIGRLGAYWLMAELPRVGSA